MSGFLLENFDWRVGSDRTLESDWLAPLKLFIISGSRPVQNKFFPRKTRPKFYNYFSNRRKNVKWGFSTFWPNTLHTQSSIEILQSLMKNFKSLGVGIFNFKWWTSFTIFVIFRNKYDFRCNYILTVNSIVFNRVQWNTWGKKRFISKFLYAVLEKYFFEKFREPFFVIHRDE